MSRAVMQLALDALEDDFTLVTQGAKVIAALKAELAKPEPEAALTRFYACEGDKEDSPLERLRFFCSLSMNGQDWLDSEQFFDALATPEPVAWINARGDYCEVSRPDTVYGSHTIPLYRKEA
jgi:hypothetical protein